MDPAVAAWIGKNPLRLAAASRLYLGEVLSLATLAPIIEQLRASLSRCGASVEVDARDLVRVTEAGRLVIAAELARGQQIGVKVSMVA